MNAKMLVRFAALGAALSVTAPLVASSNNAYGIYKDHVYVQTTSSGSVPLAGFPYTFTIQGTGAGTLKLPDGSIVSLPLSLNTEDSGYDLAEGFASESSLEATFPNGSYQLSLSGIPTLTYTLGSSYPVSIPAVSSGGTWTNGVLVLDPTVSNQLGFSTFSDYGTTGMGGHMSVSIQSQTNIDNVTLRQQVATLSTGGSITQSATPFTSYSIPAGTLSAGNIYQLQLNFDSVDSFDTSTVPNAISVQINSNQVYLYVVAKPPSPVPAPTISTNPSNQTGPLGGSATFDVGVSWGGGAQPTTVDWIWYMNGVQVNLDGVKWQLGQGGTLTVNNIANTDFGTYSLVVVSAGGLAQTTSATLTLGAGTPGAAPDIATQPASETVADGSTATLTCIATGTPSPTYQWSLNGSQLPGASSSSFVISNAGPGNQGSYTCTASNSSGHATSTAAMLSVVTSNDPGRLINLSCRASVGTGANILIAGFASGGGGTSGTQALLIRATGPALAGFGVPGVLPDPQLSLYQGENLVSSNTGWGSNSTQIDAIDSAVNAFALTDASSKDSALYVPSLAPNSYTAQVAGAAGDTGVALVEVYDATPSASYTPSTPRLTNLSARVQVGTGGNVLIAGFVVGGSTAKTVLVRASGPALGEFGLTGTLPDPGLAIIDQHQHTVASNSGWGGSSQIATVASSVGAFAWTDTNGKDSALLLTLPPGAYTAQVQGVSGDTGVALVEVYDIP
jgi:hypothetical protein